MNKLITFFFWLMTPVQKVMQLLKKPEPKMTQEMVDAICLVVEPGDALFSYESLHFTNWFIPGAYDHAAIVAIHKNRLFVVEAVSGGVQKVPLVQWLYSKDKVGHYRRAGKDAAWRESAGEWALGCIGYDYDELFIDYRRNSKVKKTYCSRLVANALNIPFFGQLEPSELMSMRKYLTPMELL